MLSHAWCLSFVSSGFCGLDGEVLLQVGLALQQQWCSGRGSVIWGAASLARLPFVLEQIHLSAPSDSLRKHGGSGGTLSVLCFCTDLKLNIGQCSRLWIVLPVLFLSGAPWEMRDMGGGGKQTSFLLSSSVLAKFQDNSCQIFPENLDPYAGLSNLSWCADVTVTACQLTRMFSFSGWVTKTTAPLDSLEPIHLNEYNESFCHSLHFSSHF